MTECTGEQLGFQGLGRRGVVGRFNGGAISSDGGALLLREVESRTGIVEGFARCFTDHRNPKAIEHSLLELLTQRVFALAQGYEDLNDHDQLRFDPLMATAVGKADPSGLSRQEERDKGKALASSSTLNRLELTPDDANAKARYKKIVADPEAIDAHLVQCFLQAHQTPPDRIWLDLDATDDPLHGGQEGRFFHGYYGHYCYLPLYIFSGEHLLCARLRPSDIDASAGSIEELERLVRLIRACWPHCQLIVRGDSGFCREAIMSWCEANEVDFVFGLAKNKRLRIKSAGASAQALMAFLDTGCASRVFCQFSYRTRSSWSRARRVVAKAEHLRKGANPRYVVTSLSHEQVDPRTLYEDLYCARGDMENRIKECQLELFADRTSSHTMRANQIRLYFSSIAYVLLCALRRLGLRETELERAQPGTIRLRLLKLGAQVRITARKVWIAFSESFPSAPLFVRALRNIQRAPPQSTTS